jgi:hypothetical protein
MTQTWHDLLFAHWPIEPSQVRARVPPAFELDLFEGHAWIGVVPFSMTNVAPRGLPALPWISAFPELNVRTYVRVADRPGVYFFSLDAGNVVAVQAARALLNLPYYSASMDVLRTPNGIDYRSSRNSVRAAEFRATYEGVGTPFVAAAGSLDYFLTERYCLYDLNRRNVPYRLEIHHPPWLLQRAEAHIARNTMGEVNGVTLSGQPPVLHFSTRQDAIAWAPSTLQSAARIEP